MNINIPPACFPYILYQRTAYIRGLSIDRMAKKTLEKAGLIKAGSTFKKLVHLNARLSPTRIAKRYTDDILRDFNSIKPHLPATASNILDIGCGIAGIDLFLSQTYQHEVNLHLIDKTSIQEEVFYGYEPSGSFYNSMEYSRGFLEQNGVPKSNIHLQEATDDNEILFPVSFDLVVSLISWGYHYPVSTYLDTVFDKLAPGGKLIIDVRKGSEGLELIKEKFGNQEVVYSEGQCERVVAIKSR
ncbi:class I SAM-dependent methyltransferase [Roseivirga misakiensis]|uniref:Methyltransferase type 11 domain-containing protein n=1 Tax=Roseivirga misakiensis TaxID=1563681 RepID=A0A1E5T5X3_9BACT|nr:class I SAM-dependent methyltransferase [Roseivirga misakiensis]OEK06760.1 hypothetical protein BFP71_03615 [Roseivirga misakiensis]